jgi:hypothetical protein
MPNHIIFNKKTGQRQSVSEHGLQRMLADKHSAGDIQDLGPEPEREAKAVKTPAAPPAPLIQSHQPALDKKVETSNFKPVTNEHTEQPAEKKPEETPAAPGNEGQSNDHTDTGSDKGKDAGTGHTADTDDHDEID